MSRHNKLVKNGLITIVILIMTAMVSYTIIKNLRRTPEAQAPNNNAIEVGVQTIKDSRIYKQTIEYAALVTSDQEAQLIAKTPGTITFAEFSPGDKVKIGQELIKIDDVTTGANFSQSGFNAGQIKQATLAVEQAEASYMLAQTNYQNILESSNRDLAQAAIARDQAAQGKNNLADLTSESLRTAELAYETSQIGTEQARINLENRKKIATQSDTDTKTNSNITAESVVNSCGTVIWSINNIADLDDKISVNLNYKTNLGVLDANAMTQTEAAYREAKDSYDNYLQNKIIDLNLKITVAKNLAESTKRLADATKYLFDKSITSASLPQTSAVGVSLTGLQATAAGYQAQISVALNQINGAEQALNNVGLNNDATITSLEKAYEIAKQQEATAKQNLVNIKSGNKSQLDSANFGAQSAVNQYESIRIKLNSQTAVARNQLDSASLAYRNATVALQSLYDSRLLVSPINGIVVRKNISAGDTVAMGQLLAIISQPENIRLQFYVDQENLGYLQLGQKTGIKFDSQISAGKISAITPQADAFTKRFLVEVTPDQANNNFSLGTIVNVVLEIKKTAKSPNSIILPLSAIEIGQNNNSVFTAVAGRAKKIDIKIIRVEGEAAEIEISAPDNTLIVVKNNKLLKEGDLLTIK